MAVKTETHWWGKQHRGSRDELVAAGVVEAEWFDRKVERTGKQWTAACTIHLPDGRSIKLRRVSSGTFVVDDPLPPHERAVAGERHSAIQAQRSRERQAVEKASSKLSELPTSGESYRQKVLNMADWLLGAMQENALRKGLGGYHFDPNDLEEIVEAALALRQSIKNARVQFSAQERANIETSIRAQQLGRSDDFERFMGKALGK